MGVRNQSNTLCVGNTSGEMVAGAIKAHFLGDLENYVGSGALMARLMRLENWRLWRLTSSISFKVPRHLAISAADTF